MAARVAILSPGSMGSAVGVHLRAHGAEVSTCVEGRGLGSVERVRAAGLTLVPDLVELVRSADIVLSIVPPHAASETAARVAAAMRAAAKAPAYADCNAVTPQTVRAIGETIAVVGAPFVDASIVGGPPRPGTAGPRFFGSGPDAPALARLRDHGLDVHVVGPEIGQASALKMCCAAWAAGTQALATELLVAGALSGVMGPLLAQLRQTDPGFLPYWNILEPLLRWTPGGGDSCAGVLERWEASPDGRTWTLALRRGVQFRIPFSELTSEDLRATFERFRESAADPESPGEWGNVERVEALDRYTVRVTLRDPRGRLKRLINQ